MPREGPSDETDRRRRLGYWLLATWAVAFALAAVATPPDALAQLVAFAALVVAGTLVAYAAVYRLGW